jgi:hypothetical protein
MEQVKVILYHANRIGAVLIIDDSMNNPYFKICPNTTLDGKWECLFEPVTNCTASTVKAVVQTFEGTTNTRDGYINGVKYENFPTEQVEKEKWLAFLSRPSQFALATAEPISHLVKNRFDRSNLSVGCSVL